MRPPLPFSVILGPFICLDLFSNTTLLCSIWLQYHSQPEKDTTVSINGQRQMSSWKSQCHMEFVKTKENSNQQTHFFRGWPEHSFFFLAFNDNFTLYKLLFKYHIYSVLEARSRNNNSPQQQPEWINCRICLTTCVTKQPEDQWFTSVTLRQIVYMQYGDQTELGVRSAHGHNLNKKHGNSTKTRFTNSCSN